MFYYKTSFFKKVVVLEKTAKNPFVGGHGRFEGTGAPGDKSQYHLFCRHRRFGYFLSNNFFEKKIYFPKYKRRIIFWGASPFLRERGGGGTTKMNINFFFGKRGTKYSF